MDSQFSLADDIRNCTLCPLHQDNTPEPATVGRNYKPGGLAVLGESPRNYRKAEELFDTLLSAVNLSRDDLLFINSVRCTPPGNRLDRHPEALVACNDWLLTELEAYNPSVVLLTGNTPMRKIYGQQAKITAVRGIPRQTSDSFGYGNRCWIPTFNPGYAVRNPVVQGHILDDLRLAVELCSS